MTENESQTPGEPQGSTPRPNPQPSGYQPPPPFAPQEDFPRSGFGATTQYGATPYAGGPYGSGQYGAGQYDASQYDASQYDASQYGPAGYAQPGAYPHASQYPPVGPGEPYDPMASYQPGYGPATYAQPGYHGYAYGNYDQYGRVYHGYQQPAAPKGKSKARRATYAIAGGALAAALVLGGFAIGDNQTSSTPSASSGAQAGNGTGGDGSTGGGTTGGGSTGGGSTGGGSTGGGSTGGGSGSLGGGSLGGGSVGGGSTGSGSGTTSGTAATATQQVGIVTVTSVLGYQNAESAGTGMILTSNGEVLTNNHVIDGATSVTVTVESTGKSYTAKVVGTSPTNDVAVLQLEGASGLQTAKVATSTSGVSVGDAVTGVGNAGGTGSLSAAAGKVTALNQSITATDDSGANAEKLHGLIQTSAAIIPGDSGGPLYDASGQIVGMDTAASSTNASGAATTAFAIPITTATGIASQIESGAQTTTIHIGLPGFLGVSVEDENGKTVVASLLPAGPAAAAGVTEGSVITKVGSATITDSSSLQAAMEKSQPNTKTTLTWTDPSGASHTATVTLATGPAD
jgi:S1-C subfamily serine protease